MKVLFKEKELSEIQNNLLTQIMETYSSLEELENIVILGIQRRGADIGKRIKNLIREKTGKNIPFGSLDINLYRDDWTNMREGCPQIGESNIPFSIDDKNILLIDDVLFSGRTARAALEAIFDYGRPQSVDLLVFIDRGNHELPICAKFIGKTIPTSKNDHIEVLLKERDGVDEIISC